MAFDNDDAQRRLEATERAAALVQAAIEELWEVGVTNSKVLKALGECAKEVADYRRATKFAINKRRDKAKDRRRECPRSLSW